VGLQRGLGVSGIKFSDLTGGGAFRWLVRLVVVGAILVVLGLRLLLDVHIVLAILAGTSLLLLGLLVVWLLLISGRVRLKL
jgi:hypothetical protein